jgi:phosphonate transport system substrate-binding protein
VPLRLLLPPSVGRARAQARAELLDQSLRADLAESVVVDVATDYAELAARTEAGDADLVWMPPTLCARLEDRVRALYKCERQGRTTYRSALVARRGEVGALEELRGKRFAWVDRLSVGGYLLAAAELRTAGVVPDDTAQFLGAYPECLHAVLGGEADAAALTVRDGSRDALEEALATYGGRRAVQLLEVVHVTAESPNDALAITRALEDRRGERVERRLFGPDGSRGRAALCLALDAEGFVRARPGEYGWLRALLR